jgi:sn-glycerol 3-phosphate transport system substrate-binding protein
MKTKKWWSTILTGALLAAFSAGCSSNGSANGDSPTGGTTDPSGAPTSAGKTVTIQFWHSLGGQNNEYIDAMVKRFNDTHPNIQVVPTYQGGYAETASKLQAAIAGNNAPDVSMLERARIQQFADADVLADLSPYMKKTGLKEEDFVQGLMGFSRFPGSNKLVSLPFNRSTPILYVNKDMLDQEGLKVPTTWDELKQVANALVKKENGKVTRYGVSMPYDSWYLLGMISQSGGKFFTDDGKDLGFIDNGVGQQVFEFLKDMQNSGALYYPPTQNSGSVVGQMFASGQIGMLFQSTGVMGDLEQSCKFNLQAVYMPKNKIQAEPTGGGNFSMLESSKNKDAAWEFMNWVVTDPKGGLQFVLDSGYLPYTKKMGESQELKNLWAKDPNRKVAFDQLQFAVDNNKSTVWPNVSTEFSAAMQAIFYDNKDIKSTLDAFKNKAKDILASQ